MQTIQQALNARLKLDLQNLVVAEPMEFDEKNIINGGTGTVTSDGKGTLILDAAGPVGPTPYFEVEGYRQLAHEIPVGVVAPSTKFSASTSDGKQVSGYVGGRFSWTEHVQTAEAHGSGRFPVTQLTVKSPLSKKESTEKYYGLLQQFDYACLDLKGAAATDPILGSVSVLLAFDIYGMKASAVVDEKGSFWLVLDGTPTKDIHQIAREFRHAVAFFVGDLLYFRAHLHLSAEQEETITNAPLQPTCETYLISPLTLRFKNLSPSEFAKSFIETVISDPEIPIIQVLTTYWSSKPGSTSVRAAALGACVEGLCKKIAKKKGASSKDKQFTEFKERLLKELEDKEITKDPQYQRLIGLLGIGQSVPAGELIMLAAAILNIRLREKSDEEKQAPGKHYPDEIESWKAIRDPAAHGHYKDWSTDEVQHFWMVVELFHKLIIALCGFDCWMASPHIVVQPKPATVAVAVK
jgi:hypothetical protein